MTFEQGLGQARIAWFECIGVLQLSGTWGILCGRTVTSPELGRKPPSNYSLCHHTTGRHSSLVLACAVLSLKGSWGGLSVHLPCPSRAEHQAECGFGPSVGWGQERQVGATTIANDFQGFRGAGYIVGEALSTSSPFMFPAGGTEPVSSVGR